MPRKKKEPKPKKEKDPYARWLSQWMITFNTNRSDVEFEEILNDAWEYIKDNIEDYLFATSSPTIRNIDVKTKHTIERGDKFDRVHLHAFISVDSDGMASLKYDKIDEDMNRYIKDRYRREYRGTPVYKRYKGGRFWAKLVLNANAVRNIEKYLKKAPILPMREKKEPKRTVRFNMGANEEKEVSRYLSPSEYLF